MADTTHGGVAPTSSPALLVSTGSVPLNGRDGEVPISVEQGWRAILRWVRGDATFVPAFVKTEVLQDDETEIVKRVHQYAGSKNPPPPREQITRLYPGYLAVTRYLDGPYFTALAGIDLAVPSEPQLFLTTIRHTQHPEFHDPAAVARTAGSAPPPATSQQNIERIAVAIRRLIAEGTL